MVWCSHCMDDCDTDRDPDKGYICCTGCGRVLDQDIYSNEPTFEKTSSGQSRLSGTIFNSVQSEFSVSRERTLNKGRDELRGLVTHLEVGSGEAIINEAHNFYRLAVERNFTRGRRTSHVAAACLYIACRRKKKPFLLIDFSDYLTVNVYVLGAVFLQLCKTLRLAEQSFVRKIIDPSLFIHRFSERLLGRRDRAISATALRIVASMKRDWMQTGRKPSGLCGAALYIAALSHGLSYSKSQIVTVVRICEATLTKRLIEFENTDSGGLTIEEFLTRADELDGESDLSQMPRPGEVLCKHKDKEPHFSHGLCQKCYQKFIKLSGGLEGGTEPPAFQRAEKQRMEKAKAEEKMREPCMDEIEARPSYNTCSDATRHESLAPKEGRSTGHEALDASACNESQDWENSANNDPESLSDIDDAEVDGYLHNEEEKHYKKLIWEEMNKEYMEEQAAKEAATAAAKEAREAMLANCSEDMRAAQELVAATAEALAKTKKDRRKRRVEEAKSSTPAETPLEATRQMLQRKTFSSRVNYKALEALYTSDQENAKKQRTESEANNADGQLDTIPEDENETDSAAMDNGDDEGNFECGNFEEEFDLEAYRNDDEEYPYEENFDYDE